MVSKSAMAVGSPASGGADSDLETIVKGRLQGRVRAFQLIVEDQGLVLRGRCLTYHAKQKAQHLVMEASALPILANEIEVGDGEEE